MTGPVHPWLADVYACLHLLITLLLHCCDAVKPTSSTHQTGTHP